MTVTVQTQNKSIKTEAIVLGGAITLNSLMKGTGMNSFIYLAYAVLASLYFFPGKLILAKEKLRPDFVISFLILCNTLLVAYLDYLLKKGTGEIEYVQYVTGICFILNFGLFLYFRIKRDDYWFVLHLMAYSMLAV